MSNQAQNQNDKFFYPFLNNLDLIWHLDFRLWIYICGLFAVRTISRLFVD